MAKVKTCGNCIFKKKPLSTQFCKESMRGKGFCDERGIVRNDDTNVCRCYFDGSTEMQEREAFIATCPHIIYDWHCDIDYGLCMADCDMMKEYDKEHGV